MRMLIRWTLPAAQRNPAVAGAGVRDSIRSMLADLRPQAAYCLTAAGNRGGLLVVDMVDTSRVPAVAEPLFRALDADVEFLPARHAEDLSEAFAHI